MRSVDLDAGYARSRGAAEENNQGRKPLATSNSDLVAPEGRNLGDSVSPLRGYGIEFGCFPGAYSPGYYLSPLRG